MRRMREPLFSIVVPTYNQAHLLTETLRSVRAQTCDDWELLVADDASDEDIEAVVREFDEPRFHYLRLPKGGGQRARNAGAEAARGRWLIFHDADDLMHPRRLQAVVEVIALDPEAEFIVVQTELFHETPGDMGKLWNRLTPEDFRRRYLRQDVVFHTAGPAWRRDFFERVGPWRPVLTSAQDFDQNLRAMLAEPRMRWIPEPLNFVRIHAGGISRQQSPQRLRERIQDLYHVFVEAKRLTRPGDTETDAILVADLLYVAREAALLGMEDLSGQALAEARELVSPVRRVALAMVTAPALGLIRRTGKFAHRLGRLHCALGWEFPRPVWLGVHPVESSQ